MKDKGKILALTIGICMSFAVLSGTVEANGQTVHVEINKDFKFVPAAITVHEGTTIWWTNNDLISHTATSPGIFDSMEMSGVAVWTYTFEEAGVYEYICDIHPDMEGKIIVVKENETYSGIRPTIAIASPSNESTISGTVKIEGRAFDSDGIVQTVDLRIDFGKWEKPEGVAEWSYELPTTLLPDGIHTIRVRSFDNSMQYSEWESISLNVKNEKGQSSTIAASISIVSGIFILVWLMKKRF